MGWTFRKRISLGKGVRLNIGRRGASIGAGRGLFGFNTGQIFRWGGRRRLNRDEPAGGSGCGCGGCLVVIALAALAVVAVGYFGSQGKRDRQAAVKVEPVNPVIPERANVPAVEKEKLDQAAVEPEPGAAEEARAAEKREHEALGKLKAAKALMSANKKAATARLKEIVEKYPETDAAAEAAKLLK